MGSQAHSETYLTHALTELYDHPEWSKLERLIVITDEQSHDGTYHSSLTPYLKVGACAHWSVNVAPYEYGISNGNGWTHIDGWSERIVDYIAAVEAEAAA